jgi:putative transcriptional regulator
MSHLKGKFLVAAPKLLDGNFVRTVILMVDHSDSGALGLILNRPTGLTVKELWAQVLATSDEASGECLTDDTVYTGGPCTGTLMALHSNEDLAQLVVLPGVYFSSQIDQLSTLLSTGSHPLKVFYGYSGWGKSQLEREMETGSWLVAEPTLELVMSDPDELWDVLVKSHFESLGLRNINPRFIPPDPSMN